MTGAPPYDDTIQGMCGFAHLSTLRDGEPAYAPTILADKTAALMAAIAICAALYRKRADGQGCYIEVPMFESMVTFTAVEHFWGHYTVPRVAGTGYSRAYGAARRPFRAADGFVCITP